MPYKNPEKQAEYMKKYRTPYMREYNRKKREELKRLRNIHDTRLAFLEWENQRLQKCLEVALKE